MRRTITGKSGKFAVLKREAHRRFARLERVKKARERRNRKNEDFTNGWDSLMDECTDIDNARDAKDYFLDVERLAKRLDLICSDGKPFDAMDAYDAWCRAEDAVERDIDDVIRRYGDDVDDVPCIGMVYRTHDDELIIGEFDRGNFYPLVGWEFKKSMKHTLSYERHYSRYVKRAGSRM